MTDIVKRVEENKEGIIRNVYRIVPKKYIDEEYSKTDHSMAMTKTSGVKKDIVDKIRASGFDITILPVRAILPMLNCHANSMVVERLLHYQDLKVEIVVGYNLTGCRCGKQYYLEVHSTIKYDGKYYDFTTDFAGEKCKYFIPLVSKKQEEVIPFIQFIRQRDVDTIYVCDKQNHRCDIHGGFSVPSGKSPCSMKKVEDIFRMIKRINVF
jgi:hypothetical protein